MNLIVNGRNVFLEVDEVGFFQLLRVLPQIKLILSWAEVPWHTWFPRLTAVDKKHFPYSYDWVGNSYHISQRDFSSTFGEHYENVLVHREIIDLFKEVFIWKNLVSKGDRYLLRLKPELPPNFIFQIFAC